MPGYFTDYANNKILDQVFGATVFSTPSTVYIGLSTGAANKSGTVTEPPAGAGYLRVAVANTPTAFLSASSGTKANATPIAFAVPTSSWGTLQSVFIADAPAGGNVLAIADLATARTVAAGGPAPTIASNALYLSHT